MRPSDKFNLTTCLAMPQFTQAQNVVLYLSTKAAKAGWYGSAVFPAYMSVNRGKLIAAQYPLT